MRASEFQAAHPTPMIARTSVGAIIDQATPTNVILDPRRRVELNSNIGSLIA
jgi:hypothetical protein